MVHDFIPENRSVNRFLLSTSASALLLLAAFRLRREEPFDVEQVGDGVYAIIRHDPEAFLNNANSLVVVGDSDVLVVDAQFTRQATLETIGAIRRVTHKPVRWVVTTHWHDDHVAGGQVYRDTFPGVQFISHENTRRDLATLGAENRRQTVAAVTPYTGRLQRLMDAGLGNDSLPIVPLERAALASTVAIGRQYLAESNGFHVTLADVTFGRSMSVYSGKRRVDIHWYGRANTSGDAIVVVPDQRVVATGDLVVYPIPFAFNSYPSEWVSALDSLRALHATAYVPGHGPVMRDDAYIARVQRMLARIRDEAVHGARAGDSLASVRRAVTLADERDSMAHGDKWLNALFGMFFVGPAVERAYDEAKGPLP